VNRFGGLAAGYYGGRPQQQKDLEAEDVLIEDFRVVDFTTLRWSPYGMRNDA
jgi:hypothetical protein